jgi:hypothetical protein
LINSNNKQINSNTMKNLFAKLVLVLSIVLLNACAAHKPWYKNEIEEKTHLGPNIENIDYELFLVGDIAQNDKDFYESNVVNLIKSQLRSKSKNQSVVFLGNILGDQGVLDQEDKNYKKREQEIQDCLSTLNQNTDKLFLIPGNNEWFNGDSHNLKSIQDSELFIESQIGDENIFVPNGGCGKPKVVNLTDDLVLVLIDSQWILQGDDSNERRRSSCEVDNVLEFISNLNNTLSRNKNKNVIIASHHPVYSNGITGGNYPLKNHLIPLPILGSVINGVKQLAVTPQKIGHPQYEVYRSAMNTALANFDGIINASAHDKNMQYIIENDNHYVIAGSGAEVEYTRKGGLAEFAAMEYGFAKITHTKDLELWLEFYKEDPNDSDKIISIYRKMLYKKEKIHFENKEIYKDLTSYPKTIKTVASDLYSEGFVGLGSAYRKEWSTEVSAPVLLLDDVEGGLKPVQQGGGFMTKSLRLENPKGQQWVLRTIDKDIAKLVDPALKNTFVESLLQDGFSANHPYGAFAIPELAEAAEIYHANPKYVWLPNQKSLGDYNIEFANKFYLFEERPGGKMKGHADYGGSKSSVSTADLINKLMKNDKHKVDQEYVLRARLFDLLIGDWDRHDDQWRWGIYKDDRYPGKKVYRSIPRDRDVVFFKNDGFLNFLASRKYFKPNLRKFDEDIDMVDGLAYTARHFDRHFLSELTLEQYQSIAKDLQENITDSAIDKAFSQWPKEIYDISGEEIKKKLKSRRSKLVTYAEVFYKHLSKEVTALGTNSDDLFKISSLGNNRLDVKVYHQKGGENHLIWSRIIDGAITDEVRLFGLKDDDTFVFEGIEKSNIKVRVIGGSGKDQVNNNSKNINVVVYDKPDGMKLEGASVKSKIEDKRGINRYNRLDWDIDRSIHFPMISFQTDEGIGLGYNVWWIKNGFRSSPYKSSHTLSLNYFNSNTALVGEYTGKWPDAFGQNLDFELNVSGQGPTFSQFFYGLGNEYNDFGEVFPNLENSSSPSFHIVRGVNINFDPSIVWDLNNGNTLALRPILNYINLNNNSNDEIRFINLTEANRVAEDFESKFYSGIGVGFKSERLNNLIIPTSGYTYALSADYKQSLSDISYANLTFKTNLTAYLPFTATHSFSLVTHIGGQYTFGNYEFFHANYLTTTSRLRGYKLNRFAGDGIVYHSSDLRLKLTEGKGKFKTGLGLFTSFDYGRAFLEDENNNDWHTSYGGGIYITPFNMLGFKIGYYTGRNDSQLAIGGGLTF